MRDNLKQSDLAALDFSRTTLGGRGYQVRDASLAVKR
jgi:hypothetical protein